MFIPYRCEYCIYGEYNHSDSCWENGCSAQMMTNAKNYSKKMTGHNHHSSEWIPCSERLPEDCKNVLVWYEYFRYGDYNRMFQTYGIGFHVKGQWCGDVNGVDARCIAWQPLPEAYQGPTGEDKDINNCQEAAGVRKVE